MHLSAGFLIQMSYTIVTGLVNIGRDEWSVDFRRTWEEYLGHFENVLRIDAPMVIFVEFDMVDWVTERRKEYSGTRVVLVEVCDSDFVLHSSLGRMAEMQMDSAYREACVEPSCPEACIPMYNVVVNNKVEFVARAAEMNPWNTDYFVWLDAGYGHSKFYIPEKHVLDIGFYLEKASADKVVINTLADEVAGGSGYWDFFRVHQDFMDGGLVVMSRRMALSFRDLYYSVVREAMDEGITDDDQYHMTMTYLKNPDIYELVRISGWDFRSVIILG